MATLEFTERMFAKSIYGALPAPPRGQEIATQSVAIGAASAASAAFNTSTQFIEITHVGADCRIAIGPIASVVALNAVTPTYRLRAGQRCRLQVEPGHALAVIAMEAGAVSAGAGAGITATASFTPAAGAYSANDIMDVAKEFAFTYADGSPVASGALIRILTTIVKIDATVLQASEAGYQLQCYAATPPSAQADNAAWTLASGDLSAYRGAIALGTPVDLGAALYVKTPLVDLDIKLTGTSLWAELQTLAGFTPTAVARQVFLYGIVL